jgi:predicted PolB exonuclease-like 3'-5' exonuclease
MVHKRREETNGGTDYPHAPFHKVVCVCTTIIHPDARVEIKSFAGDDERANLAGFYGLVAELARPRLVSWNGRGFDLPILRYRAMVRGVAAPGFYDYEGDARIEGYLARYGTMHADMMDELSGHGASSHAGLANVSRMLDLPGKSFLERTVWEHWIEGDRARVIEYCKLDTILTMLIYGAWSVHTGAIDRSQMNAIASSVRGAMSREPFEGWRALEASLENWPGRLWGAV